MRYLSTEYSSKFKFSLVECIVASSQTYRHFVIEQRTPYDALGHAVIMCVAV